MPATGRLSVTPSGLAATLLVFLVAAVCIRLGFWQLDRLAERRQRNDQLAARLSLPAVEPRALPTDTTGWLRRHIILRGQYDVDRSIVLPARYLAGVPGVHVVTPLRLPSGEAVLVNRGWLPAADGINADPAAFRHTGTVEVRGLVLPFFGPESSLGPADEDTQAASAPAARDAQPAPANRDAQAATVSGAREARVEENAPARPESARDGFRRVWFTIDEAALRAQFPYPLGAVHIRALSAEHDEAGPRPLAAPSLSSGPHLSYAIQWFSFAVIALAGWAALVRKAARARGRGPATARRTTSAVKGRT